MLGVTGGTFIGQGLGFIPGSFMTGDPQWAVVGTVLVAAALALVAGEVQRVR